MMRGVIIGYDQVIIISYNQSPKMGRSMETVDCVPSTSIRSHAALAEPQPLRWVSGHKCQPRLCDNLFSCFSYVHFTKTSYIL